MNTLRALKEDWGLSDEQVQKINSWAGIDLSKAIPLGTGQHGTAHDVGNNRVLKFTDDDTEADASSALINKHHKNVVNIYKVGKITTNIKHWHPDQDKKFNVYLILQEKLQGIPKDIEDVMVWLVDNTLGGFEGITTDNLKLVDGVYNFESDVDAYLDEDFNDEREVLMNIMKQIFDGIWFLKQQGVDFYDLHTGNLMFRDSKTPAIIDLGVSATNAPGKIDILQEYIRKLLII